MSSEQQTEPKPKFRLRYPLDDEQAEYLFPKFYRLSYRYCSDSHHTREDYVQEALMELVAFPKKWRNPYRAAHYVMLSLMRDRIRERKRLGMAFIEELDRELRLVEHVDRHEIEQFMGLGIPEEYRLAAVAFWTDGKSRKEVAEEAGVTEPAVDYWLRAVAEAAEHWWGIGKQTDE